MYTYFLCLDVMFLVWPISAAPDRGRGFSTSARTFAGILLRYVISTGRDR